MAVKVLQHWPKNRSSLYPDNGSNPAPDTRREKIAKMTETLERSVTETQPTRGKGEAGRTTTFNYVETQSLDLNANINYMYLTPNPRPHPALVVPQ